MTALRLISLPTHAVLELVGGILLMAVPFALGFSAAGLVAGVVIGALVVGLALSAVPADRGGLPIAAHYAFDRGIAVGLLGGALVLGLAGDDVAAAVFAAAALAQTALTLSTRYTARA